MPLRRQRGYSLIELIVVVVLIAIIAGITGRMLAWGIDMFDFISVRKDAMHAARLGVEIVVKDLRSLINSDDINTADDGTLIFDNLSGVTITLEFDEGSLIRNENPLIQNLSDFRFRYYDINELELGVPVTDPSLVWRIDFSLDAVVDGNPFHMESSVIPRSF